MSIPKVKKFRFHGQLIERDAYPFRSVGVTKVPDVDHRVRLEGGGSDKLRGLDKGIVSGEFRKANRILVFYLLRIPCNSADSFPAHVVECQAFLLRLDIPHCDETSTATGDQDVGNLLIPIQALNIIGTGCCSSQSERILYVVQV